MKQKNTKWVVFPLIFFFANIALAQHSEYVFGKLIDAKTKEPVVFASIYLKNRSVGVTSNLDGGFKIPEIYREMGDILVISSMGYVNQELKVSELSVSKMNLILLEPAVFELTEVVLKGKKKRKRILSAKQILRKAVNSIPANYPVQPFSTVGYYRDYQMEDGQYVNLNEALLNVFDLGFNTIDTTTTKTQIYSLVQNKEFRRDTLADRPYNYKEGSKVIDKAFLSGFGGNEFTILKVHDAIRNYQLNSFDFINVLKDLNILKKHTLKKASDVNFNDELLYVVEFNRNKDGYLAKGIIYISKTDFAIHKLEYVVYDNSEINDFRKYRKNAPKGKLIFESTTEYKRNENGKMYLNYISFHNSFRLRLAPKFTLDMLLLDINAKRFELTFNHVIDSIDVLDYSYFKVFFKGKPIKFTRLVNIDEKVYLYPLLQTKKQLAMWNELKVAVEKDKVTKELIDYELGAVKDVNGNVLNEYWYKDFNQFREFFVQEVKPSLRVKNDTMFMDNRKPLFKNQPILKPANFSDYWMNTPLQNSGN